MRNAFSKYVYGLSAHEDYLGCMQQIVPVLQEHQGRFAQPCARTLIGRHAKSSYLGEDFATKHFLKRCFNLTCAAARTAFLAALAYAKPKHILSGFLTLECIRWNVAADYLAKQAASRQESSASNKLAYSFTEGHAAPVRKRLVAVRKHRRHASEREAKQQREVVAESTQKGHRRVAFFRGHGSHCAVFHLRRWACMKCGVSCNDQAREMEALPEEGQRRPMTWHARRTIDAIAKGKPWTSGMTDGAAKRMIWLRHRRGVQASIITLSCRDVILGKRRLWQWSLITRDEKRQTPAITPAVTQQLGSPAFTMSPQCLDDSILLCSSEPTQRNVE